MRIPIEITDDMQNLLGCDGVTLESAFVEPEASPATVFGFQVHPARRLLKTTFPVVKYSERRYAIPRARYLKLATPRHYRNYEGDARGVRDGMEAKFKEDVRSFLTRYTLDRRSVALVSGSVTYGIDDFWMFCTTLAPALTREREFLRDEFGADCETNIADPSEFARALGAAFVANSSWSDVCLCPWDKYLRQLQPPEIGDKFVWVYHGPVLYANHDQPLVESFSVLHPPVVVPFVKRQRFSRQKEYRFTVKINGNPKNEEFLLPIPPELRRLARIG